MDRNEPEPIPIIKSASAVTDGQLATFRGTPLKRATMVTGTVESKRVRTQSPFIKVTMGLGNCPKLLGAKTRMIGGQ